jgi:hypothetical protein
MKGRNEMFNLLWKSLSSFIKLFKLRIDDPDHKVCGFFGVVMVLLRWPEERIIWFLSNKHYLELSDLGGLSIGKRIPF